MRQTLFVTVYLDQNLTKALDYSVPEEWSSLVEIGMRVEVPLRSSIVKGTIAEIKEKANFPQVRPLNRLLSPKGELSEVQWKLAQWMAQYYAAPLQKVLKCFIPPYIRKEVKEKTKIFLRLNQSDAKTIETCEALRNKHPAQAQVLDTLLQEKKGKFLKDLLEELKISRSAIDGLIRKKYIEALSIDSFEELLLEEEFFPTKPKTLNPEQTNCLKKIEQALQSNQFSSHLIYGITGSGKTEVYLQAIDRTLKLGKSAILLVPEISLTSQTIERLRSRFSEKIAILHHQRSLGERNTAWTDLREGKIQIVLGARSAIFSPIQKLGLIIVDEEHDSSYKQNEEAPCYQGRDIAVMRARLENCVVMLGSATPSIESRYNAAVGKYQLHTLSSRATTASLPKIEIIDMKREFELFGGFTHFSGKLLDGIKERIQKGEQTLLFLNKRGYHRMQLCASCRFIIKCPHCDISLTYHKKSHELRCHLCDFKKESLRVCPQCSSNQTLEFKGFGTEHVERSLHAIFPDVRTLRMDRDTTSKKGSHEELFQQFRSHKADVLIGTQMIAKGFHFPSVTLVGVLNIDASLSIPDFRSPEHVFQLLVQVAGRSGRSDLPGEVLLQTFLPDHPVMRLAAAQEYDPFYEREIEERRLFGYPPFCHLVKLIFSSREEAAALSAASIAQNHLATTLAPPTEVLGVTPGGHPKIKDLYRFQFLIKTPKISAIKDSLIPFQTSQVKIDVDPISTFF